jgi:hypothetical protein
MERAEASVRQLADAELRWVLEQPGPLPGPPSGRPPLAPAVSAVNRVRAVAGALISSGEIDEAAALSVLDGLLSTLTERSKLPAMHPYSPLLAPRFRRRPPGLGLPPGPVRLMPVGKPVPFPESDDESRLLHLLTMAVVPDLAVITYAGRVPVPEHVPAPNQLYIAGQESVH